MEALYQKQILELAQQSRLSKFNNTAPFQATFYNPTCGDKVEVSFSIKNASIQKIGIKVSGCALCEAGAGLLLKIVDGVSPEKARQTRITFSDWITNQIADSPNDEMQKFLPVRSIRNRHKCVLLAFDALCKALD